MNFLPLIRRYRIHDKTGKSVVFDPNWAQLALYDAVNDQYNAGKPIRQIILKARQLGVSTAIQAFGVANADFNAGSRGLTLAHIIPSSQHLLSMAHYFSESFPFRPMNPEKSRNRTEITWANGSSLKITTAKNVKAGRGMTIQFLHASEVGFWDHGEDTMLAIRQTVPNDPSSAIFLESTANGVGNYFHQQWLAAETGESEFNPLFFPWYNHPEYTIKAIDAEASAFLGFMDEEERALHNMGVGDDRLAWRRWAIRNLASGDVEKFKQEYPSTPEEAFIQSGSNVFPLGNLRSCYDPMRGARGRLRLKDTGEVEFVNDTAGPLTVFRWPSSSQEWGSYIISGDPIRSSGGVYRDYACAQVLNPRTMEQVAIWRGQADPQSFAQILAELGKYYNWGLLVPEMQGGGYATIGKLNGMKYPHIYQHTKQEKVDGRPEQQWGWSTSSRTKPLAISTLLKFIVDETILIHDKETFTEMSNYVVLDDGSYGPGSASLHDDTVSALSIAAYVAWEMLQTMPTYGSSSSLIEEKTFSPQPSVADRISEALEDPGTSWEPWDAQDAVEY